MARSATNATGLPRDSTAKTRKRVSRAAFWLPLLPVLLGGCGGRPHVANIELRKQVIELERRVEQLGREREADRATIVALQSDRPTTASLPQERLDELFTVGGIRLGRLTGGFDADPQHPGDESIRVHLVPVDASGDDLKAAGTAVVEAFDLSAESPRLGRWSFDVSAMKASWNSSGLLYEYVLDCPLAGVPVPVGGEVTLRVTFTDSLTGRSFSAQQVVRVRPG